MSLNKTREAFFMQRNFLLHRFFLDTLFTRIYTFVSCCITRSVELNLDRENRQSGN